MVGPVNESRVNLESEWKELKTMFTLDVFLIENRLGTLGGFCTVFDGKKA